MWVYVGSRLVYPSFKILKGIFPPLKCVSTDRFYLSSLFCNCHSDMVLSGEGKSPHCITVMEGFKKRNILEQSCHILSPAWHLCSGREQVPSWGQPAGRCGSGRGCGRGHSGRWQGDGRSTGPFTWTAIVRENWVFNFETSPSAKFMAYGHILRQKTRRREKYEFISLKQTNTQNISGV